MKKGLKVTLRKIISSSLKSLGLYLTSQVISWNSCGPGQLDELSFTHSLLMLLTAMTSHSL